MSTTVLFVELLVCGAQAGLWILLVVLAIFGSTETLALWKQYTTAVGAVLVVWAYAFGVVFDRLWDLCLKPIDDRIRNNTFTQDHLATSAKGGVFLRTGLPQFVDYIRTRMRIARATFCNTLLSTCAALWLITSQTGAVWSKCFNFTLVVGFSLTVLCLYAFENITDNYYNTLLSFHETAKNEARGWRDGRNGCRQCKVHAERVASPPNPADGIIRVSDTEWRVVLRWSREALAAVTYEMTFWFMSKIGEVSYQDGGPTEWSEMTPAVAG